MTPVLNTEELFKVTYRNGDFECLMKQYYTDKPPFYFRTKGSYKGTNIETSSHDINDIIKYYGELSKQLKNAIKKEKKKKIKEIHRDVLASYKEFFDKSLKYMQNNNINQK